MEKLLQYVWKHKLFPLGEMTCSNGARLEVIDVGLQNTNAGPDFFNAKVKIDGTMWVGNIEVHDKSSLWYQHGHHTDKNYNNVVLHVAEEIDSEVTTEAGETLPQYQLSIPEHLKQNYEELISTDKYPPCYKAIPTLPRLLVHSWMSALQTERLEDKTRRIADIANRCTGDWEKAYFVTLSRNFGFSINGEAFEHWAMGIPLSSLAHHCDDLFQVEAIFMGQAGLIDRIGNDFADRLRKEYTYLRHKFSMQPMDPQLWKYLRLRPSNFPHVRISQLATLYYEGRATLSRLIECEDVKQLRNLYETKTTDWCDCGKKMSVSSKDVIIINTAIPMLFAYGKHKGNAELCAKAFSLYEQLKAEDNHIVTMWKECGLEVSDAGDSQALIQLKKEYCDKKDCLRCRIGFEYLRAE